MKKVLVFALVICIALMSVACASKVPSDDEVKGSNNGSVYTNDYVGLKFTANGAWSFLTDEEIAEVFGTTQQILEDAGNDVQNNVAFYDMMAMDEDTGNNINIMIQVVGNAGDVDFEAILDESEVEILQMGASIGATYSFSEHKTVKLSGVEFNGFTAVGELPDYGVTYEQGCYIAFVDGVFVNITITSYDGTPISDIEAMFN